MHRSGKSAVLLFAVLWAACCGAAWAQGSPASGPPPPAGQEGTPSPGPPPAGVEQSELETFYLIDEKGKLVPFYNMPFEEFEEVYKLYKKLKAPDEQRRYVLQELTIDGTADRDRADLQVQLKILTRVEGWVRVPLLLNDLVLRPVRPGQPPAKMFLEFDEGGDGFVCWIRGVPDQVQTVKLTAVSRTRASGGKTYLAFNAPRATMSQLTLRVAGDPVKVDLGEGPVLQQMRSLGNGRTELTVLGLGGAFQLGWQPSVQPTREGAAPLHVTGNVLINLIGDTRILCEAGLNVQSSRAAFDSFVVRLPPGMRLVPVQQPGFTARVIRPEGKKRPAGQSAGQLVEVKLDNKTTGPEEVRLIAEWRPAGPPPESPIEVAGFEVLGTPFQSGSFSLAVGDDWTVQWTEGPNVRRVESISDALRRAGVVARFAYDAQPCTLKVQLFRKRKRLTIEPEHRLYVEPAEVRLITKLKCKLRGAKTETIHIDLTGWEVDDIAEADLIDAKTTRLDRTDPLVIHLAPSAAGQLELTIHGHRTLDESAKQSRTWSLPIPRPEASTLAPATVAIFPAENVALSPLADQSVGLVPEPVPSSAAYPPDRPPAFYYREAADARRSVFVSQFEIRKRSVSTQIALDLQSAEQRLHVRQRLLYQIDFEPLSHLLLAVPRWVSSLSDFSISLDNKVLPWDELPETARGQPQAGLARLRVDLLGNRIGACNVVVGYSMPLTEPSAKRGASERVPLILPADPEPRAVTFDRLSIESGEAFRVAPDPQQWRAVREGRAAPALSRSFRLAGATIPQDVRLSITAVAWPNRRLTVVQQAWVQTWMTSTMRQERAVFRLTTSESRIRVEIPSGATLDDAAVNGRRIGDRPVARSGQMTVDLPGAPADRAYVVELWYRFAEGRPAPGRCQLELPHVLGARWIKQFYWQLLLPRDEHLLLPPAGLTPELRWTWQGLYWARRANLRQADLERRTGATHQAPLPEASNQYVFSSFGPVRRLAVTTASRRAILLGVSMAAFLAGLLLIYFSALHHPAALLTVGLAMATAGVLYPELALQAAQTASLGIAFVVLAQLLKLTVARPRERGATIRGTSRAGYESSISETITTPMEGSAQASTSHGSLSIQRNAPDSKS